MAGFRNPTLQTEVLAMAEICSFRRRMIEDGRFGGYRRLPSPLGRDRDISGWHSIRS